MSPQAQTFRAYGRSASPAGVHFWAFLAVTLAGYSANIDDRAKGTCVALVARGAISARVGRDAFGVASGPFGSFVSLQGYSNLFLSTAIWFLIRRIQANPSLRRLGVNGCGCPA